MFGVDICHFCVVYNNKLSLFCVNHLCNDQLKKHYLLSDNFFLINFSLINFGFVIKITVVAGITPGENGLQRASFAIGP